MMMGLCDWCQQSHIYANMPYTGMIASSGASIHPPHRKEKTMAQQTGPVVGWLPHDIYADMPCAGMELAAGISARR